MFEQLSENEKYSNKRNHLFKQYERSKTEEDYLKYEEAYQLEKSKTKEILVSLFDYKNALLEIIPLVQAEMKNISAVVGR